MKKTYSKEKRVNAIFNIGLNDKDSHIQEWTTERAQQFIGEDIFTDGCTITMCIGYYKGERETSMKVEVYNIRECDVYVNARYIAVMMNQECVAVTIDGHTEFIGQDFYIPEIA